MLPAGTASTPFFITAICTAVKEWLENFEQYIQKNISTLSLSVLSFSLEFAMSESTLLRQLKQLTGLTPLQYMQEIRLNEARQLLENRTYKSVAQVAEKVGYSDARSFSRAFQAALFLKLCARASKPASTLIFSFPG